MRNVIIVVTVSWKTGFTTLWTLTQKHDPGINSRYLFQNPNDFMQGMLKRNFHHQTSNCANQ